ncbi:MAG: hypothetical protein EPN21_12370 [Methylococcaceae bacterium]|nr:MAG: hypothetical protein EPN21_12370 [Methylococcaceae bacterium]
MKNWLLLILSLPTANATVRMRVWRALKAVGCAVLRDGVYLLPQREPLRALLEQQADEVSAAGGTAYVLSFDTEDAGQQRRFAGMFDRSEDYAKWMSELTALDGRLATDELTALQRAFKALQRNFEALSAVDYLPGAARQQAAQALAELKTRLAALCSPGEPQAAAGQIATLARAAYQGRRWATRQRPWIDRLASAWLIRRFIDPQAGFLWLADPQACPADALGFDFDGAAFTHVGHQVTFEVLQASFGLQQDAALQHLGKIVHYLDVGGMPVAEAPGIEAIVRGIAQRSTDDDALLAAAEKIFDDLYLAFAEQNP